MLKQTNVFASIILFVIYSFVLVPEEVDAQACASNGQCRDTVGGPCISAPAGKFSNAKLTCDLCGPGRFSSTTGTQNSCTSQCAAGRYWSNTTGLMTTSNCAGFTRPGAFSAQGSLISTTPDGDGPCPVGKFSVSGGACTVCPPGYASTVVGTGPDCFAYPCPLGTFYQASNNVASCVSTASITRGRYGIQVGAPDSTQYVSTYSLPCPAGRFATTGQSSDSCQGPCSAGYFCAAGSITSTPAAGACPVGKANPLQGMTSINDCVDCEAGFVCSSTASISLRGATLSRPTQVLSCSQGRFGARGQSASTCSGSCYPGYWCPAGSVAVNTTFPEDYSLALSEGRGMFPCGSVSRYCPAGTSAANGSAVPAGNLGIPIPGGDSTLQFAISTAECPANIGTVCLGGVKVVCQPGQWRFNNENNCRTCEPGYRCPTANSTVRFSCGSFNNTASQFFSIWYCPRGSIEPLRVTPGYFTWRDDGSNPPHINRDLHTNQTICDRMGICVDGIYTGILRFPNQAGNTQRGMQNRQLCAVPNMAGGIYGTGQTVMVQEAMRSPQSNQKILASASIPSSLTVSQTVVSISGFTNLVGQLTSVTWAFNGRINDAKCQPTTFAKNKDLFSWNQTGFEIIQTRYNEPDYLNFEVCAPYTNGDLVRYQAIVTFTANGIYPSYPGSPYAGENITLNINCTGLIQVLDMNDRPRFTDVPAVYERQIPEKTDGFFPATGCSSDGFAAGCVIPGAGDDKNGVPVQDDEVGSIVLFAIDDLLDNLPPYQGTFEIGACSGEITLSGEARIRYIDAPAYTRASNGTLIPACAGLTTYDCQQIPGIIRAYRLSVRAFDNGNLLIQDPISQNATENALLTVFVVNVPDAPTFRVLDINFTVPELTTAGTEILPSLVNASDPTRQSDFAIDEDFEFLTYTLKRNDDFAFEIVNNTLRVTPTGAKNIDFEGLKTEYSIDIQVTDTAGLSTFATFTIFVENRNDPPVITTNTPFYVLEETPGVYVCSDTSGKCDTTLGGPGPELGTDSITATDADNEPTDIITYELIENAGGRFEIEPNTGFIKVQTNATLDFESSERFSFSAFGIAPGFIVKVRATSSGIPSHNVSATSKDAFITILLVNKNEPPSFPISNEDRSLTLFENHPLGVRLANRFFILDPDDVNAQSVGRLPQQQVFEVIEDDRFEALVPNVTTPSFGQIRRSFNGVPSDIDFETAPVCLITGPSPKCIMLTVRVTDSGGASAIGIIFLFILDLNEAPVFVGNPEIPLKESYNMNAAPVALPNSSVITPIDPDANSNHTYIVVGGTGQTLFQIQPSGLGFKVHHIQQTNFKLDFENGIRQFSLVVEARDNGLVETIGSQCSLSSNTCSSLGFAICNPSILRCVENCSNSLIPRMLENLLCNYTDTGSVRPTNYASGQVTVLINVENDNDAPEIRSFDVAENTCVVKGVISQKLLSVNHIASGELLSITFDKDFSVIFPVESGAVEYSQVPGSFNISTPSNVERNLWDFAQLNSTTGVVTILANTFPFVEESGVITLSLPFKLLEKYVARVKVSDISGASTTCKMVITMRDGSNPPDLGPDTTVFIPENSTFNSTVFSFSGVVDPDVDDIITFEIAGSSIFSVNSNTGRIFLVGNLDFETAPVHQVSIIATDSTGNRDAMLLTITVLDSNDPPNFSNFPNEISFPENSLSGFVLDTVSLFSENRVQDEDSGQVVSNFAIECVAPTIACPFAISNDRIVVTSAGISGGVNGLADLMDFEKAPAIFNVRLTATDPGGLSSSKVFVLRKADLNERPVIIGNATQRTITVREGQTLNTDYFNLGTLVTDPDFGNFDLLSYTIINGNSNPAIFSIRSRNFLSLISSPDFEFDTRYDLEILVADTAGLNVSLFLTVNVLNDDDVTVASVSPSVLPCNGNAQVVLTGSNFGFHPTSLNFSTPVLVVTYQSSLAGSKVYTANNCTVTSSNTQITCQSVSGGIGRDLIWHVSVTVESLIVNNGGTLTGARNRYDSPIVLASQSTNLRTSGGEVIQLTGQCLGDSAEPAQFSSSNLNSPYWVRYCPDGEACLFASSCNITALNTITCFSVPGVGKNFSWFVNIANQQTSSQTPLVSGNYLSPVIVNISHALIPTSGTMPAKNCPVDLICPSNRKACGDACLPLDQTCTVSEGIACTSAQDLQKFIIKGTNFGILGSIPQSVKMVYAYFNRHLNENTEVVYTWSGCVVTKQFTEISCDSVTPGVGNHLRLEVKFGLQTGVNSDLVSLSELRFVTPLVNNLGGAGAIGASTVGGQFIEIIGANFGPKCPSSIFDPTKIQSPTGFIACPLLDVEYGHGGLNLQGIENKYQPFCRVESQSFILCETTPGTGANNTWTMLVGSQLSPGLSSFKTSYTNPTVGAYEGPGARDALTPGSQTIEIFGSNFGPVDHVPLVVRYGPGSDRKLFLAKNCSVSRAHERVTCQTNEGAGNGLVWTVFVDGQESTAETSYYAAPSITNVLTSNGGDLSTDFPAQITILGANFGPPNAPGPFLETVFYGSASNPFAYLGECILQSHSEITCRPEPGIGQNLKFRVQVRGQSSPQSAIGISYRLPTILSLSRNSSTTNGGARIDVKGLDFSLCDPLAQNRISFGSTPLLFSNPRMGADSLLAVACIPPYPSDAEIRTISFLVPPMSGSRRVPIGYRVESSRLGQVIESQNTLLFTYDPPEIKSIFAEPQLNPTILTVLVLGVNFCTSESCCRTFLNGEPVEVVYSHSHNLITFESRSVGDVFIRCGPEPSDQSNTLPFTSQDPHVVATVPNLAQSVFPTDPGTNTLITIYGVFFGLETPNITVGGRRAQVVLHEPGIDCIADMPPGAAITLEQSSDAFCYRTTFRLPPGEGKDQGVVVANGNKFSFANEQFEMVDYLPPTLGEVSFSVSNRRLGTTFSTSCDNNLCFGTRGGDSFTFTGSNLGTIGNVWFGFVGNIKATITSWTHSEIRGRIPEGEGKDLPIVVEAGGQIDPQTAKKIDYQAPKIIGLVLPTGPGSPRTSGGELLQVIGTDFGRSYEANCDVEVRRNCTTIPMVIRLDNGLTTPLTCTTVNNTHENVFCLIPPGAGKDISIRLSVASQEFDSRSVLPTPIFFAYGRAIMTSISPNLLPTTGLDENGSPVIMRIQGSNFGLTDLCVKILDPSGNPADDFAIAMRAVTATQVFNCRQTDGTPPPSIYVAPGFVSDDNNVYVIAPEFYGANVSISVEAGGQASFLPLNISYIQPTIDTVAVTQIGSSSESVFPASGGSVIGRQAFNDAGDAGYGKWSTSGLSTPACLRSQQMRSWGWNITKLDIDVDGQFNRSTLYYVRDPTCAVAPSSFSVEVRGKFDDLGPHARITCAQVYEESTDFMIVTPLSADGIEHLSIFCQCGFVWQLGVQREVSGCVSSGACKSQALDHAYRQGFGAYLIGENSALYMGDELFSSRTIMEAKTQLNLPDSPTAGVVERAVLNTATGPTDGCLAWEDDRSFEARRIEAARRGRTVLPSCIVPAVVRLSGSNFGVTKPGKPSGLKVIFTNPAGFEFEAATTSSAGSHSEPCTEAKGCKHSHNELIVQIPPGYGRNMRIRIEVGVGRTSQTSSGVQPLFHYDVPQIIEAVPGTVQRRFGFLDANGQKLILRGYNFGGESTNADILLNGKVCLNATWQSGLTDPDGQPYLICDAQRDIVGPKSVFVCVAEQATVTTLYREDAEIINTGDSLGVWSGGLADTQGFELQIQSMVNTRCQVNQNGTRYFANFYGLCTECKSGADCETDVLGSTSENGIGFAIPKSEPTYYRYDIPILHPNGSVTAAAQARCPPESWDINQLTEFPQVVLGEFCFDFVRCVPEESCLGNNECAIGYQYALEVCEEKRAGQDNSCPVFLDPYTLSWKGNSSFCNPTGKTCTSKNPENCATCQVSIIGDLTGNVEDLVAVGECKCTQPERCALCTMFTHFRLYNECEECPDNPGLLIGMFFTVAFIAIAAGYYLQRKNFNLAFISIGVDYCQVLAMFASTKIEWPPLVQQFFKWLSLINFNIDVTAPECLVPNLEYPVKWYAQEMIPFGVAFILIMYASGYSLYKWKKYKKEAKLDSHFGQLIAIYCTMFYYLYLNVTKKALDIFNCNPVDPFDGYYYTEFSSILCEGGLCRCYEANGVQTGLIPAAVICLVVYTFGFPAYLAQIFFRYRRLILEDQYLRAEGLGENRKTNPNAYDIRKRYHKLYFHFVPEKTYWILVILLRKFLIAFASLMFRGNASFQMAFVLLVLFWSYVLQVINRPYMSTGEVDLVKEHLDLMCRRSAENKTLEYYNDIKAIVLASKRVDVAEKRKMQTVRYGVADAAEGTSKKKTELEMRKEEAHKHLNNRQRARAFFVNYNTVESTLLASLILICLCGVMFESSRLDREDLHGQRDALSYFVIFVVMGSFIYYFTVFFAEMSKTTSTNICIRCFLRRTRPDDLAYDPDRDTTIKLGVNPFHQERTASMDSETHRSRAQTLEAKLTKAEEEKAKLSEELARIRAKSQASKAANANRDAALSVASTAVMSEVDTQHMDRDERSGSFDLSSQADIKPTTSFGRLAGSIYTKKSAAQKHKEMLEKAKSDSEQTGMATVDMKAFVKPE